MSESLNKGYFSFSSSSQKGDEMTKKQGIVSILGSDNVEKPTRTASLRKTLSADMSSKVWLGQNGFSISPPMMKKIASSKQITVSDVSHDSSSSEDEEEHELDMKDVWTSILSQKVHENSAKLPPPYVHPLVKTNVLSEKSLKVCTESLGSETGSDVFSSFSSLEMDNENKCYKQQRQQQRNEVTKESDREESQVVKHEHLTTKKDSIARTRSFPLPLSSIAPPRREGSWNHSGLIEPSLQMHSHRVDGRLVLEAISVPSQTYFETQRQDGRLLLTVTNTQKEQATLHDVELDQQMNGGMVVDDVFNISVEDEINENEEQEEQEEELEADKNINNSNVGEEEEEETAMNLPLAQPITQSLPQVTQVGGHLPKPPRPPLTAATSLNSYQYMLKAKPTMANVIDPLITQNYPPIKTKAYDEQKEMVLLKDNKVDWLLPSLKGCKKPRRSLLMWEPYCIAT